MGLDTVTLVVDTENYFGITIDNKEAANITTVQQFIDLLYTKLQINPSDRCKSQMLFYRFREYFHNTLGIDRKAFLPTAHLRSLLNVQDLVHTWSVMQSDLQLKLPDLMERDIDPTLAKNYKVLGIRVYGRSEPVTEGTVKGLVHWTLALNHKKLIDPKNICSKKELEDIFLGILSQSSGVPVHEIELHHSFTGDLGMD